MKFFITFFICLTFLQLISAQRLTPTELSNAISKLNNDSPNSDKLGRKLFYHYTDAGMPDSVAFYARKLIKTGQKLNSNKVLLEGYASLGFHFMAATNLDSTTHYLNKILDLTEFSDDEVMGKARADALMYFGAMYQENDLDEEKSFHYLTQAIEVSKKHKYQRVFIICNISLIIKHLERKEYDDVNRILTDAYKYLDDIDSKANWSWNSLHKYKAIYLANVGTSEKEKVEAVDLILSSYSFADSTNRSGMRVSCFLDIATHMSNDIPKEVLLEMAEKNYTEGLDLYTGSQKGGVLESYGKILIINEKYDKAIPLLKEAKELLKENTQLSNYLNVCDHLIEAYEYSGQRELIVQEFEDYKVFQDSFIASVYSDKLLDLEEKYETETKENENAQLLSQNKLIHTRFRLSTVIGSLLFGLLAISIYFFLKMRKNKKELEQINEGKNRLFAIVAHDLKGPAEAFSELSESVSYLLKTDQTDRLMALSEYYENAGKRLSYKLTNLLDWAISQKDNFVQNPQSLDMKNVVDNIIAELDYSIAKKELTIENKIDAEKSIYFDKDAFIVIIRNLLHNSIKFSHKKSSISIGFSNKGLQVSDYGIGMDIETKQKILSKQLVTSKRGTSNESGSGIGLSTCIKLAEQNNAQLLIESLERERTTFTLTLPKAN